MGLSASEKEQQCIHEMLSLFITQIGRELYLSVKRHRYPDSTGNVSLKQFEVIGRQVNEKICFVLRDVFGNFDGDD